MQGALQIATAFTSTRFRTRSGVPRARFEAWQQRKLQSWLRHDLPQVGFYKTAPNAFHELPVIDKSVVMAQFAAFNRGQITAQQGWAAFEGAGRLGEISVGASTGTSGNRSLYAITSAEQHRWLGVILAKAIPRFLVAPERVAVILPQSASLYKTAAKTRRISLKFFDLKAGVEAWGDALQHFAPTTIVAPPRVLRHLTVALPSLRPRRLFAGAETLDPVDQRLIEAHFGVRLGQIYMASEGLLGVTCAHHKLHLAEDANHFELEPVANGLHSPLITSFQRQFQIMARYRMNDLLRMSPEPCTCGSPLRVVDEIVGRMDDVFMFGDIMITPDILRNAVLDAARDITDFRIKRLPSGTVSLILPPDIPEPSASAALSAVNAVFRQRAVPIETSLSRAPLPFEPDQKLRRIENQFHSKDAET